MRTGKLFVTLMLFVLGGCAAAKPIYPITKVTGRYTIFVARFFQPETTGRRSPSHTGGPLGLGTSPATPGVNYPTRPAVEQANSYAQYLHAVGYDAYVADLGAQAWVTVGAFDTIQQARPTLQIFIDKARHLGLGNFEGTGPKRGEKLNWPRIVSIKALKRGPVEQLQFIGGWQTH